MIDPGHGSTESRPPGRISFPCPVDGETPVFAVATPRRAVEPSGETPSPSSHRQRHQSTVRDGRRLEPTLRLGAHSTDSAPKEERAGGNGGGEWWAVQDSDL